MAIYLKDANVDRLAREVASMEGISITDAIGKALEDRRTRLLTARDEKLRKVQARLERIWALPVLDDRPPNELLYDEDGLPR